MRLIVNVVALVVVVALVPPAHAQTADEWSAWTALVHTPVGGLPPYHAATHAGSQSPATRYLLRYGQRGEVRGGDIDTQNGAITVASPWGPAERSEFTLGLRTCIGCSGTLMAGAAFYSEVACHHWGPEDESGAFVLAFRPEVGVGQSLNGEATFLAAGVGLPLGLALTAGDAQIQPFVSPGAGYGTIVGDGDTRGDVRVMLGGGVGIYTRQGIGIHGGVQHVFLKGAQASWGVGISWAGVSR